MQRNHSASSPHDRLMRIIAQPDPSPEDLKDFKDNFPLIDQKNFDVLARIAGNQTIAMAALEAGLDPNLMNPIKGLTFAATVIIRSKDIAMISKVVGDYKADLALCSSPRMTQYVKILMHCSSLPTIQAILQLPQCPNILFCEPNSFPLVVIGVICNPNPVVKEYLLTTALEKKFDINFKFSPHGATLLAKAAECGDTKTCDLIIEKGGNVNESNHRGLRVLHHALYNKRHGASVVNLLIDRKADTHIMGLDGYSLLHCAVLPNHNRVEKIARTLIQKLNGATVRSLSKMIDFFEERKSGMINTVRDAEGRTPLHVAVLADNPVGVQAALKNGADLTIKTAKEKQTVLDFFLEKDEKFSPVQQIVFDQAIDEIKMRAYHCRNNTELTALIGEYSQVSRFYELAECAVYEQVLQPNTRPISTLVSNHLATFFHGRYPQRKHATTSSSSISSVVTAAVASEAIAFETNRVAKEEQHAKRMTELLQQSNHSSEELVELKQELGNLSFLRRIVKQKGLALAALKMGLDPHVVLNRRAKETFVGALIINSEDQEVILTLARDYKIDFKQEFSNLFLLDKIAKRETLALAALEIGLDPNILLEKKIQDGQEFKDTFACAVIIASEHPEIIPILVERYHADLFSIEKFQSIVRACPHVAMIQALVNSPSCPDMISYTPGSITFVVFGIVFNPNLAVKKYLLDLMLEKIPINFSFPNNRGCTLLACVARAGNAETCELIIERGGDINASNPEGARVFHHALGNKRHADVVDLLFDRKVDVRLPFGFSGNNMFHYVISSNNSQADRMFHVLNTRLDPASLVPFSKETNPLKVYAEHLTRRKNALINAPNRLNQSPLYFAIKRDQQSGVEGALKNGADLTLKINASGDTILDEISAKLAKKENLSKTEIIASVEAMHEIRIRARSCRTLAERRALIKEYSKHPYFYILASSLLYDRRLQMEDFSRAYTIACRLTRVAQEAQGFDSELIAHIMSLMGPCNPYAVKAAGQLFYSPIANVAAQVAVRKIEREQIPAPDQSERLFANRHKRKRDADQATTSSSSSAVPTAAAAGTNNP